MKKVVYALMDGEMSIGNYSRFEKKNSDDECLRFLEYGSCELNVINGAIGTSLLIAGWKVQEIRVSAYNLLQVSPASRAEFTAITGSDTFPVCKSRWVENVEINKRFLLVFAK